MDVLALIGRFALAAAFVMAALGKLSDRDGSRRAVQRFGVPAAFAGGVGVGLPLVELAIAGGLVVRASAALAAIAAASLLVLFCAGILRLLARGEQPDCHCFGAIGSAPVGRGTLVRNLVLLGLAGFVAVATWNGAGAGISGVVIDPGAAALVLGVVVVLNVAFSWQLFQQNGRLLERVSDLEAARQRSVDDGDSLAVGDPAPAFALPDLDGRTVSLGDLLRGGRGAVLVFTDPACGSCNPLLPALGRIRQEHETPVAVISRGPWADNHAKAQEHGIAPLLLQEDFEVAERYRVFGLPGAVLVDAAGRIASPRAAGAQAVGELLEAAAAPVLSVLAVAPDHDGGYERAVRA